ncbi:hypothetical protein OESDEN_10767 [Oesophagostomum dentatum]|uniref:Uncharacterized protein n=1 Tax=Oesophagostomum dentatum TaxID=61180 RepID=A0A0B1SWQ6_OESDE|nr:hypothetical protein OESDEN_10767 [Oesophagostomum dentatum]
MVFVTSITCLVDVTCIVITMVGYRTLAKWRTSKMWNNTEKSLFLLACSLCVSLCCYCAVQCSLLGEGGMRKHLRLLIHLVSAAPPPTNYHECDAAIAPFPYKK